MQQVLIYSIVIMPCGKLFYYKAILLSILVEGIAWANTIYRLAVIDPKNYQ